MPYERPRVAEAPKEKNGVVYTKPWVIDLILDLVGYTVDVPLHDRLVIEPSAGDGSFLLRIAARLVESCRLHGVPVLGCASAIVAYELDDASAEKASAAVVDALTGLGVSAADAAFLAGCWVRSGDYLMEAAHMAGKADFVVGNPPIFGSRISAI